MKKAAAPAALPPFEGFSRRTVSFFKDLAKNNNKAWFDARLLLHTGLWASHEEPVSEILFSARLVDYCFDLYRPLLPLHGWLLGFQKLP